MARDPGVEERVVLGVARGDPVGHRIRDEPGHAARGAGEDEHLAEPGARLVRRELGRARLHDEIAAFAAGRVRRIAVLDPIFHENPDRAVGLLHEIRRAGVRAQLSLQGRFELVDEAFLDAVSALPVVLEFGLQTVHEREASAIKRPNRMDRVSLVIDRLRARMIPFEVSLIYGLPLQTAESFAESVKWCLERGVPRVRAWPMMLLRGTPLYIERERWGFVESVGERIPIVVASGTFSQDDHARMAALAAWLERNPTSTTLPAEGPP